MAWTTTRPSGDIVDADIVRDVFLTDLNTDLDQAFENFGYVEDGTALDAKGSYSDLGARLDAMDIDIQNAGTGTAKVRVGTHADRLALSSPSDGLIWVESDTSEIYTYSASSSAWYGIYPHQQNNALLSAVVWGG